MAPVGKPSDKELASFTHHLLDEAQAAAEIDRVVRAFTGKGMCDILRKSKHKDAKKLIKVFERGLLFTE